MNKVHILSFICFITGIFFFALGFLSGDIQAGIIVVIPFLSGSGFYAFIGFIFLFLAIILFMFGFTIGSEVINEFDENQPKKKSSIKTGGVILIGPIPIIFGSNWKIALVLMLVSIILIIVAFFAIKII